MPLTALGQETTSVFVAGVNFEMLNEYQLGESVAQGSYGTVCSAIITGTDEQVAVKKVESVFDHITFTRRTLREVRVLRMLQHENIVKIYTIYMPGLKDSYEDIYLVSDLMESDLGSIIKSNPGFSEEHIQFFLYQILRAVLYIHSAKIIHCDIRPRNCLVNANCDLKLSDFGQSRVDFAPDVYKLTPMTEYVCTRWYRAPEALCSWNVYSPSIDIWSTGCTFAEMMNSKPLFPGQSTRHQLRLFTDFLGTRIVDVLRHIANEKCVRFLESLEPTEPRDFDGNFPGTSDKAVDLFRMMIEVDPERRCSAEEALSHTFLESLHSEEDEPTREPLDLTEFEFERRKVDQNALRNELYREMLCYYPDVGAEEVDEYNIMDYTPLEDDGEGNAVAQMAEFDTLIGSGLVETPPERA
jgi:serine/threonine protein kinase